VTTSYVSGLPALFMATVKDTGLMHIKLFLLLQIALLFVSVMDGAQDSDTQVRGIRCPSLASCGRDRLQS
jgi:hypothetical protein